MWRLQSNGECWACVRIIVARYPISLEGSRSLGCAQESIVAGHRVNQEIECFVDFFAAAVYRGFWSHSLTTLLLRLFASEPLVFVLLVHCRGFRWHGNPLQRRWFASSCRPEYHCLPDSLVQENRRFLVCLCCGSPPK